MLCIKQGRLWDSRVMFPVGFRTYDRHVSLMRTCDGRIFRLLSHFSLISAKCAYRMLFPHKLAFSISILILFVFLLPTSIRFCYLDHLVANRMVPSMCPDPCGTRSGSLFQAILYHISPYFRRMFGVHAVCIFFKCHMKMTCLIWTGGIRGQCHSLAPQ